MDDIFVKLRFLIHGKQAPKNSRFSGFINTTRIFGEHGWYEYTSREDANVERIDEKNDEYYHSFFEYTSREDANVNQRTRDHSEITYTNYGLLSKDDEKKFIEESKLYFKNKGDIVWDTVISFKDFDYTTNHNLNTIEDYGSMLSKILPSFFNQLNLKNENMMWWMNYHSNTDNPHIHLSFFEKNKTRSRGKITESDIETLKTMINKELFLRKVSYIKNNELYIHLLKQKDESKAILIDRAKAIDFNLFNKVENLFQKLPNKGRLQYSSIHMKQFRNEIDEIVNDIIQSEYIKDSYDEFVKKLDEIESFGSEVEGGNLGYIKEVEIRKLHINIANLLLSCKKDFKFSEQTIVEDVEADTQKGEVIFDQGRKIFKLNPKNFLKQNATFKHNLFCKSKGSISKKKKELEEELEKYLNQHKTLGGELSV